MTPDARLAARAADPGAYLATRGLTVRPDGQRHLSVRDGAGDELYRLTRPAGDRPWLWTDRHGQEGGDNIDLVQELEPGTSHLDAVWRLVGAPTIQPRPAPPAPPRRVPPRLPTPTPADREAGRTYLAGRRISPATLDAAEAAGMLGYADGAVLFCGLDADGQVQNVTCRAIDPEDARPKRSLRGSNASWPAMLRGDPGTVVVVEGGTDALALHDRARRRGGRPPTVIASGGARVLSWIERCRDLLTQARSVIVVGDREQAARIADVTGCEPKLRTPPRDKDVAALHEREVREAEQAEAAAGRLAAEQDIAAISDSPPEPTPFSDDYARRRQVAERPAAERRDESSTDDAGMDGPG